MKFISKNYKAVIDLGSNKICCWIGEKRDNDSETIILGSGHTATKGIFGGQISDVGALEEALISTLYEAEQQANVQARQALIALSGAFFCSNYYSAEVPIEGHTVTEQDIKNLMEQIKKPDYYPIHIIPIELYVDQQTKIIDPRGLVGKKLGGHFHVIWMDIGKMHSLMACFKRCQLHVTDIIFSGYASALACLAPDEQELGATLVDIGASTTTLAFFVNKKMVGSSTIPLGGHHINYDIARGCETQLAYAERIKILYGAALSVSYDHYDHVPILPIGEKDEEAVSQFPRAFLVNIIQARCEEILSLVKKNMQSMPYRAACQRVILTGGTSQLPGLRELTNRILNCSVRIGKSVALQGATANSNEFSAVIGAFGYQGMPCSQLFAKNKKRATIFSWFKKFMIQS